MDCLDKHSRHELLERYHTDVQDVANVMQLFANCCDELEERLLLALEALDRIADCDERMSCGCDWRARDALHKIRGDE